MIQQQEQDKQSKDRSPRVNGAIRIREVKVISDDGSQLGIIPTVEAIRLAAEKGLDLVEVQPHLKPPVCKIMDYGKFKYQQKRNAVDQKKKQKVIETKQIKFSPNIEQHDFNTKVTHIKEFLAEGNRVLTSCQFSGREMAHTDLGKKVLDRVIEDLKDVASVEGQVKLEGKSMFMMLVPSRK